MSSTTTIRPRSTSAVPERVTPVAQSPNWRDIYGPGARRAQEPRVPPQTPPSPERLRLMEEKNEMAARIAELERQLAATQFRDTGQPPGSPTNHPHGGSRALGRGVPQDSPGNVFSVSPYGQGISVQGPNLPAHRFSSISGAFPTRQEARLPPRARDNSLGVPSTGSVIVSPSLRPYGFTDLGNIGSPPGLARRSQEHAEVEQPGLSTVMEESGQVPTQGASESVHRSWNVQQESPRTPRIHYSADSEPIFRVPLQMEYLDTHSLLTPPIPEVIPVPHSGTMQALENMIRAGVLSTAFLHRIIVETLASWGIVTQEHDDFHSVRNEFLRVMTSRASNVIEEMEYTSILDYFR